MVITKPVPNRTEPGGVRSGLYRGMVGPLPDPCMFRFVEAYADFMNMTAEKPLVECAFGLVQEGSALSFQQPLLTSRYITLHDAPPSPPLSLEGYYLAPTECTFVCSEEQSLHLQSLNMTLDMAQKIEAVTRDQSSCPEWHDLRKPRVTASRFREMCHVRGLSSAESLAEHIIRGCRQTAEMRRGAEMESEVTVEYSKLRNVNYSPCGLIVHPDAPWIGASPDGVVFDPTEHPQFELVEVKCPKVKNFVDCKYLQMEYGAISLSKKKNNYWSPECIGVTLWCGLRKIILCSASTVTQPCIKLLERRLIIFTSTHTCINTCQ
ncbi:uncharacterized protein LOC127624027 [Xyrauchen texanus]|uniref:uncharacterized protein LOC127624027 n=1 Tax=Xyrauchen texanus TaxID=154827 RepID=UPI002241ABF3|nr:uncharacterized protein LOC127624027 [Xyrauchen texanus]